MDNFFGSEVILTGDVKYIREGEDPAENPLMKAYAKALKEFYKNEKEYSDEMYKCFRCDRTGVDGELIVIGETMYLCCKDCLKVDEKSPTVQGV